MSSELLALMKRIQPPPKPRTKHKKTPEPSAEQLALLNRMDMRDWLYFTEEELLEVIMGLRRDVKLIEHMPHCYFCRMELQLDVERYNGTRSLWYLDLENNEYLEEQYPDCPKGENYRLDNYWAQVERCRTGVKDDTNTMDFIMDRSKWAYKIMGNQIKLCRRLLRMVRNWDFNRNTIEEYNKVYDQLGMIF